MAGDSLDELVDSGTGVSGRLLAFAVVVSLGGDGLSLLSSADRYPGETAARDFALRDARIERLESDVESNKRTITRIDETHPPPDLLKRIHKAESDIVAILIQQARNGKQQ